MNDAMLGFIELERFLASTTAEPRIVANIERGNLALDKYIFGEGALLRLQRKIPLVSSKLAGSNPYSVDISNKEESDITYFILDKKGRFIENYGHAIEHILDFTGAEPDTQKTFFCGMSGQRTYSVSTNRIEYVNAINLLGEKQ